MFRVTTLAISVLILAAPFTAAAGETAGPLAAEERPSGERSAGHGPRAAEAAVLRPEVRFNGVTIEFSLPTFLPPETVLLTTILGPNDEVLVQEQAVGWFAWAPTPEAADGIYRYEVRPLVPGLEDELATAPSVRFRSGLFRWQEGRLTDLGSLGSEPSSKAGFAAEGTDPEPGSEGPSQLANQTVSDPTPSILFDDTSTTEPDYEIFTDSNTGTFQVLRGPTTAIHLSTDAEADVEGSLTLNQLGQVGLADLTLVASRQSGDVGVGTALPLARLHVFSQGSTTTQRLQAGTEYHDLRAFADGGFQIEDRLARRRLRIFPGTPDNALVLRNRRLGILTENPQATLHVAGSGQIDGDVVLASSRSLKTGFANVNPAEVLAGVADLPIASWRYKTEDESIRHVGPFAEDFQRLFHLGDGETISVIDAQGVALAATQALRRQLLEKAARIADLDERLIELESELETVLAATGETTELKETER